MIRLLVNTKRHGAGSLVAAGLLGEAFVARLVAAGQATEEPDITPADPVDAVLHLVGEFNDQMRASVERLGSIVAQAAALDEAGQVRVATLLLDAMRPPETGPNGLGDLLALARPESDDGTSGALALGPDGRGETGADAGTAASQAVTASADGGAANGAGAPPLGTPTPNDKPPSETGPSGDAGGASAPSADPPKAPAPKPARRSAGAAKAKPAG